MAGHVAMKKEIVQGIFGGLVMILIVASIGSVIGSSVSLGHHDEGHGDAAGHAAEGDTHAAEGDAAAAEGDAAAEGEAAPKE